jgi:hypothetical protein
MPAPHIVYMSEELSTGSAGPSLRRYSTVSGHVSGHAKLWGRYYRRWMALCEDRAVSFPS